MSLGCISPLMSLPLQARTSEQNTDEDQFDNEYVQKVDLSTFNVPVDEEDELYQMLAQGLLNANRYALTTWFSEKKNLDEDTGDYYDLYTASGKSGVNEYVYRFPATQAFGVAVSLVTGVYNEEATGVSAQEAKDTALKLVTSIAYAHKANGGHFKAWGDDWQAAHWAYYAAWTAWLFWDDLSSTDQDLIRNMVVHEADRFNNLNAVYWKTANGKELYAGDSKIEEDGWNAELLNLAATMFPKHEHAGLWQYRFIEYQLGAFAVPSMNESEEIVHGRAAKDWIFGYNVNEDGTVINHGIVHPTYNAASTGVNTSMVNSMVHQKLPEAARINLDKLYGGLTSVDFKVEDGYRAPGGTIYTPDSYAIYCPQGNDWGGEIYDVYVNIDVSAMAYGYGQEAEEWAKLHMGKVLEQQARHEDGHTYASSAENSYAGGEEAISMRLGCALMTWWLAKQETPEFENYPVSYPAAELPALEENQQRIFASEGGYIRDGGSENTCFFPTDVIEVKKDGAGYSREGYVKFDLSGMASLPEKCEVILPYASIGTLVESREIRNQISVVTGGWTEEELTWKNRPAGEEKIVAEYIPSGDSLRVDITEAAQKAWSSDRTLSLHIQSLDLVGGDTFVKYGSPRQADLNMRPQLIAQYGEEAQISLNGPDKLKKAEESVLQLEGANLPVSEELTAVLELEENIVSLQGVLPQENTEISGVNHTLKNTVSLQITSAAETGALLGLQLLPLAEGETTVTLHLFRDGEEIAACTRTLSVSAEALSGSLAGIQKEASRKLPLDDTTARPGEGASGNAARAEMDMKTYGANANTRQSFVKFPLPESAEGVEKITLNLNLCKLPNVTGTLGLRAQFVEDNDWTEETLTWDSRPAAVAGITGTADTIPAADENTLADLVITPDQKGSYISVDVTEKALERMAAGEEAMSVMFYSTTFGNLSAVFWTKESADESVRPYIETSYEQDPEAEPVLKLRAEQQKAQRYDSLSWVLSAEHISGGEAPQAEILLPAGLVFESAEALDESVAVTGMKAAGDTVRISLDSFQAETGSKDLLRIHARAVQSGSQTLQAAMKDSHDHVLQAEASVDVAYKASENLSLSLEAPEAVAKGETLLTEAVFSALEAGTDYVLHLESTEQLQPAGLFCPDASLQLEQTDEENTWILRTLAPGQESRLQIALLCTDKFEGEQTVSVTLHDEEEAKTAAVQVSLSDPADKTGLEALVSQAAALNKADWTRESWNSLQEALKAAETWLGDENATGSQCDAAAAALQQALEALVPALSEMTNVALHKPVQAHNDPAGNSSRLTDGSLSTRWDAGRLSATGLPYQEEITPGWAVTDLQDTYMLEDITLQFGSTCWHHYSVSVSLDGENWREVYVKNDETVPSAEGDRIALGGIPAAWIRVDLTNVAKGGDGRRNAISVAELSAQGRLYAEEAALLEQLKDDAAVLQEEDYTAASWQILAEALAQAEELLAGTADRDELEKAKTALEAAMNGLEKKAVKTLLEMAVQEAERLEAEGALEGVNELAAAFFEKSLQEAKAVLADENAAQKEADQAWRNLVQAIHMLDFKTDKSLLEALLVQASQIEASLEQYEEAGQAEFLEALAYAREVFEDPAALSDQSIAQAVERLQNAMADLVKKPAVDLSLLQMLVNTVRAADLSLYQASTVQALQAALEQAELVLAHPESQEQVDAATEKLHAAWLNLRLLPDEALVNSLRTFIEEVNSGVYALASADLNLQIQAVYEEAVQLVQKEDAADKALSEVLQKVEQLRTAFEKEQQESLQTPDQGGQNAENGLQKPAETIQETQKTASEKAETAQKGTAVTAGSVKTAFQTAAGLFAALAAGCAFVFLRARRKAK